MNKEFVPYEQALELKELGYDLESVSGYSYPDSDKLLTQAILYQQAFRWFREKYNFTYSIGSTNIGVVHTFTTHLLQDNATFEEAQFECLKKLIETAKQI